MAKITKTVATPATDIHGPNYRERYLQLVDFLGDQAGKPRGWKADVAAKLGISASLLSKIIAGKPVGKDLVQRASAGVGINPLYFAGMIPLNRALDASAYNAVVTRESLHELYMHASEFIERAFRGDRPTEHDAWTLAVKVHNASIAKKARAVLDAQNAKQESISLALDLASSVISEVRELAGRSGK